MTIGTEEANRLVVDALARIHGGRSERTRRSFERSR